MQRTKSADITGLIVQTLAGGVYEDWQLNKLVCILDANKDQKLMCIRDLAFNISKYNWNSSMILINNGNEDKASVKGNHVILSTADKLKQRSWKLFLSLRCVMKHK